jgi:Spy/CpxP family protein refolding chaperone
MIKRRIIQVLLIASLVFGPTAILNTPTLAMPNQAAGPTPTKQPSGPGSFTIDQTLSDNAQLTTIAFSGLGFLTGTFASDSFFPPGKVADFWGFQYLRDNDPSEMGHNTDFLTKAAFNMLNVLSSDQKAKLITLAKSQVASINQYGANRFVLITAFRRQLSGDIPAGKTALSEAAVKSYSATLYKLDGKISYERAQVMGKILYSLTSSQKASLAALVGKGMLQWPTLQEPTELRGLTHDEKVAVMTYAGDMFSWYAGSVKADVYFCPERQGTYFGSFYLKDAPAVGNPGYSIGTNITADLGNAFLATLNPTQAALITGLVSKQKPALLNIVTVRTKVSTELRKFMAGKTANSGTVQTLMDKYGQYDGTIVYNMAMAFSQVNKTLTPEQTAALTTLRTDLLGNLSTPSQPYLYASPIPMPTVPNTDFLFK